MGNINLRTETLAGSDYRWLASARGTEHPKSGTADLSTFSQNTDYPNGALTSGLPLAYNSGSGLYEQADPTGTADNLAGFILHDTPVVPGADPTIAVVTDVTINAALVPGTHDLVDGRYQTDIAIEPGS